MWLKHLRAESIRCLSLIDIELAPGLNVLAGDNGSGKTSFLEAIYLLGHGRSFRSRHAREVISSGAGALSVFGICREGGCPERRVGVSWHERDGQSIRVDGVSVRSASVLARMVPMLVVNADAQRILSDGASERRAILDWLLFHVEPGYHESLRRFRRALMQRNAALRSPSRSALASWTQEVAEAGETLNSLRAQHVTSMLGALEGRVRSFLGASVEITFQPGWSGGESLHDLLVRETDEDRRQQRTRHGPHRADLQLRVRGRPVHRMLSRGEGKLLVYALALAQVAVVAEQRRVMPLLLLDDLPAELDAGNRRNFLSALLADDIQAIVTGVTPGDVLSGDSAGRSAAVFHVERGTIARMI